MVERHPFLPMQGGKKTKQWGVEQKLGLGVNAGELNRFFAMGSKRISCP